MLYALGSVSDLPFSESVSRDSSRGSSLSSLKFPVSMYTFPFCSELLVVISMWNAVYFEVNVYIPDSFCISPSYLIKVWKLTLDPLLKLTRHQFQSEVVHVLLMPLGYLMEFKLKSKFHALFFNVIMRILLYV